VSGGQGHGAAVDTDGVLAALNTTRPLRHALDVLWDNMPGDMLSDAIRAAFFEIDEQLRKAALADLRRYGLSRDYLIISPINPMKPPGPEDMEKVAAALCALDDLGLIITL
jgi:hypothetical protein